MKSAVAIGGASALATVTSLTGLTGTVAAEPITAAARKNRQHAWGAYLDEDARGIAEPPAHRVLLFVNYEGERDGSNDRSDRQSDEQDGWTGGSDESDDDSRGDRRDGRDRDSRDDEWSDDGRSDDERSDDGWFDDDRSDDGFGWLALSGRSRDGRQTVRSSFSLGWWGGSGGSDRDDRDDRDGSDDRDSRDGDSDGGSDWWGGSDGSDDGNRDDGNRDDDSDDGQDGADRDDSGGTGDEQWTVSPDARAEMEAALQQLEAAFEWSNAGLLFTVSYSPTYFDRHFEESLPTGVDLRPAQETIDATRSRVDPDDVVPEDYDICIDLASDNAANVLAAEQALFGEIDEVNGVTIEHDISGVVERQPRSFPERRTGFVGPGEAASHVGESDLEDAHDMSAPDANGDQGDGRDDPLAAEIDDDAPLSMGFQSLFEDNVPREDGVTMVHDQTLGGSFEGPGQFGQGSIQHTSKLRIDLEGWYEDNDIEGRTHRMFSPHHDTFEDGVGNTERRSGGPADAPMRDHSADDDLARRTQADARDGGVVGHAQKLARSRFDLTRRDTDDQQDGDLETTILRRDFNTTDATNVDERSALHFVALMRFNGYMHYVRQSMNGVNFDNEADIANSNLSDVRHTELDNEDVDVEDDGFLAYVTAHRRGNYVVPPLTLRSLPTPRAIQATVDLPDGQPVRNGETVEVAVRDVSDRDVDPETARFGPVEAVNQARGASPESSDTTAGGTELHFEFPVGGFQAGARTAKFRAQTTDGVEVQGTTTIDVTQ